MHARLAMQQRHVCVGEAHTLTCTADIHQPDNKEQRSVSQVHQTKDAHRGAMFACWTDDDERIGFAHALADQIRRVLSIARRFEQQHRSILQTAHGWMQHSKHERAVVSIGHGK